jgi:hypothetical protein
MANEKNANARNTKSRIRNDSGFLFDYLLDFRVLIINIAMKQMKIILLLVFIISAVNSAFSQKEVCACASYSSLQYEINYENIFPHDTIRKEKITQVIIYTTGNSSENPSTPLFTKYIESKFHFDKNGYVSCRIQYRAGRPNEIYEFERNEAGQVTKQTFTYLDSLGQKYLGFPPQITDYSYDNNNNLVLEKQRDVKGQIVDEKKLPTPAMNMRKPANG